MRFVLKSLAAQHGWTQTEAGRRLGVSQQTAGQLMGPKAGGFSRPTALALAKLCGFDSPESMLADLGAQAKLTDAPTGWPMRDLAMGIALRHGYDEQAVTRVVSRYAEDIYRQRPVKWWMTKFGIEDAELAEERRSLAAEAPPSQAVSKTEEPKKPSAPRKRRVPA